MHAGLGTRGATALISTDPFVNGGFGGLVAGSDTKVTLAADATLNRAEGDVTLSGRQLEIDGSIIAPGGSIKLSNASTKAVSGDFGFNVASGALLSTAGTWINDQTGGGAAGALTLNGGSIQIDAAKGFNIAAGAVLDVSAGAWLQSSGKLATGKAGSLVLNSNAGIAGSETDFSRYTPVTLRGQLRGYGFDSGGKLSMTLPKVRIGGSPTGGEFGIAAGFFSSGGFTDFTITAPAGFTVADNTRVAPVADTWQIKSGYARVAGGASMTSVTQSTDLPAELRTAVNLAFSSSGTLTAVNYASVTGSTTVGRLTVGEGAQIVTGLGGSLSFSAGDRLSFLGSATAASGSISLAISPSASDSFVYEPDQVLWIGDHASLNVAGGARIVIDPTGRRSGEVRNGGTINIDAKRGYIVAQAGSVLDVSGGSGTVDMVSATTGRPTITATTLASNGGSINFTAREGALIDSTLKAQAGGAGASGGGLNVKLTTSATVPLAYYPVTLPHDQLVDQLIVSNVASTVPVGLAPGQAVPDALNGQAKLSAARINAGQFADVSLSAEKEIVFQGNTTLNAQRSIVLDAPTISGGSANVTNLNAVYVGLGNRNPGNQTTHAASSGDARLNVNAGLIDFAGMLALSGFSSNHFSSSGDIRFRGLLDSNPQSTHLLGRLDSAGALDFSARQMYPTTLSEFTIAVPTGPDSRVSFAGGGETGTPLSAGGKLTVEADRIVQGGDIRAPLGSIALDGRESVTLTSGSITSVSGGGNLIPTGQTQNGKTWIYDLGAGAATRILFAPPEKRIDLAAPTVNVNAGASVNLSGGGDLLASEWVPGLGGSTDYLNQPGVYAVLPGYDRLFAPSDFKIDSNTNLRPGDKITLPAGGGLAAGTYTLLPGYYALLPGAFVITPKSGFTDLTMSGSQTFADTSAIVPGRRLTAANSADARSSGFLVESRQVALSKAEYSLTAGNDFFPTYAAGNDKATPRLARDAGVLSISASLAVALNGGINLASGRTTLTNGTTLLGRGGDLDISAPLLAVVDEDHAAPGGYLALNGKLLSDIGAESLLLGGIRHANDSGGFTVIVGADKLILDNASQMLRAGEVVLAANTSVTLAEGARIEADTSRPARGVALNLVGDGALVRVANDVASRVSRSSTSGTAGLLKIGDGVSFKGPTLELDATFDTKLGSGATIDARHIRLSSSLVSFGAVPVNAPGLTVDATLLTVVNGAQDLGFRSYSSLDFYGPVSLGSASLASLTLDASALTSRDGNAVHLQAQQVALHNTTGVASASASGAGQLDITATGGKGRAMVLGAGDKQLNGFSAVTITTPGEISVEGAGALHTAGALTLGAARISGASRADQTVSADGVLTTARSSNAVTTLPAATGLGARLKLSGASVVSGADIVMPTGNVTLQATGSGAGDDVTVAAGATIFAGGIKKVFDSVPVYTNAGSVTLNSANGSVNVRTNAVVDVSADPGGGDGGRFLAGAANGAVNLGGQVKGFGGSGGAGGRMQIDTSALPGLGGLATKAFAGGFTESFGARVRTGNVSLESGKTIAARNVTLSVDGGSLTLNGSIDADATSAGSVQVYARDDLTLAAGASITAVSSGSGKAGGQVTLGSTSGTLTLAGAGAGQPAASINVGSASGAGGELTLRAARTLGGNDVKVATIGASIVGADKINVEAVKNYSANGVTTTAASAAGGNLNIGNPADVGAAAKGVSGLSSTLQTRADSLARLLADTLAASGGLSGASAKNAILARQALFTSIGSFVTSAVVTNAANAANGQATPGAAVNAAMKILIAAAGGTAGQQTAVANAASGSFGNMTTYIESRKLADNVTAVATRLGLGGDSRAHVTPGIEIDSSGSFTLGADWNFGAQTNLSGTVLNHWHANSDGGTLTIRAAGGLNFSKNLNDGFITTAQSEKTLLDVTGWNYRLAAGADLSAANPMAVKVATTAADLTLGSAAMVRTGAGSIDIAAARDIVLSPLATTGSGSTQTTVASMIYSAGRPVSASELAGVTVPVNATFTHDGGNIDLAAGRDVVGAASDQLVTNWLWRRGSLAADGSSFINGNTATAWWTRFDLFRQNVGALGGGGVRVAAGRDVNDLSVDVPTSGRFSGTLSDLANFTQENGGDAVVTAGRNISGGQTLVMKGEGSLAAGGDLTQGKTARSGQATSLGLFPLLALGDGKFKVDAVGDLNIEAVINPTQVGQISTTVNNNAASGRSHFFTYGSDSGVSLTSLVGDISLLNDVSTLDKVTRDTRIPSSERLALNSPSVNGLQAVLQVYPPNLQVAALSGSVLIPGAVWLLPAANSRLDIFAYQDIRLANGVDSLNQPITGSVYQSDADPASFPRAGRPAATASYRGLGGTPNVVAAHAAVPVHLGDPEPVRFIAETGDIVGGNPVTIASATEARIIAGRDIRDLGFYGQNPNGGDTVITAGRDIRYSEARSINNTLTGNLEHMELGGTGNLLVTAGRNVDLGSSTGIITRGNLNNPSLSDAGAAIRVMTGANAALDLSAFNQTYLDFSKHNYRAALLDYVRNVTGNQNISDGTALSAFAALSAMQQGTFADQVTAAEFSYRYLQPAGSTGLVQSYQSQWQSYAMQKGVDPLHPDPGAIIEFARTVVVWQELSIAGKSAASAASASESQLDYQRGYDALSLAKLGGPYRFQGDLKMIFSQIKTERGGGIDLYVPGGGVNVGLATLPAGFDKDPANLGILALKSGAVRAVVNDDFEVNKSRVFTLLGGNILIWSSNGGIDAGKGAKTAFAVPPPLITFKPDGTVVVEYPGIASGSGIGALQTDVNVAAGDVELYAPTGTVNAGDAGIRAQNVTIAAARVLGADNITATGSVTGAPAAAASSAPAAVAPSTAATQKNDGQSADATAANRGVAQGMLTVEVLDSGDGTDAIPDDSDEEKKKKKKSNG